MVVQLTHTAFPYQDEKFPLLLLCDGVNGPANIGGLFRISDAFGVSGIVLRDAGINFNSGRLVRTSRNTIKKTPYKIVDSIVSELHQLKANDYLIIGLELTTNSIPIETFKCSVDSRVALIIGGENHGISNEVLQELDAVVHITMHGKNSSMNVVQATGIALHQILLNLKK